MTERPVSDSSLESLRKDAKRWLRSIRSGDAAAIARLRAARPTAPAAPTLRDVQHALARERGFPSWRALTTHVPTPSPEKQAPLTDLLEAAVAGNVARLRAVLDTAPELVNERGLLPGHTGLRTALHHAAETNDDAVRLLLERGADPNIRDDGDWAFPLHFAAEKGLFGIVRLLVEHGADPIGAGDYHELEVIGWATAFEAVTPSHDLVDYLLGHGARHNIFSAVAVGNLDAIRAVVGASAAELERRMDPANQRRKPLHLAVVKRQPAALSALLDLGADPDSLDESGLTPLDQAVLSGQQAFAQMLVDRGAHVTLIAAVVLERDDDIRRFLALDPDGLKPGHRWGTAIIRAAGYASGRVVERLIQLGASPNVVDDPATAIDAVVGYTALHAAAWRGNTDTVRVLLARGADPRVRDSKYCATPAGWADFAGHTETRDAILGGPVDPFDAIQLDAASRLNDILASDPAAVNRPFDQYATCDRDEAWHTPLVTAVVRNNAPAVRVLLAHGATLTTAPDGRTLLDLAGAPGRDAARAVLDEFVRSRR